MANLSVKKGDNVMVIAGKDKGKVGKVLKVDSSTGRLYVEGVNMVTKSKKPRNAQDKGGLIKQEGTIDASNVMVVCPACNKPTRVYHAIVDGKKLRIHGGKDGCGKPLDTGAAKKSKKAAPVVEEEAPKKRTRKRSQKAAEEKKD